MVDLKQLHQQIKLCTKCDLCKSMPFSPVTGTGNPSAKILLVGEAPGEDESLVEEPFVGMAGRMLDRLLKEAGLNRTSIHITNLVKCRPTVGKKNRPPTKKEIKACTGWIADEIMLIKPKVIFTLGKLPTIHLLNLKSTMKLHDYVGTLNNFHIHDCMGEHINIDVIPNLHPSYIMQYGKKEISLAVDTFKKGLLYV